MSFRGGSSFSVRGGLKFDQQFFNCKGVEGPAPGGTFDSQGFLMQSKVYWALFLTHYIIKS